MILSDCLYIMMKHLKPDGIGLLQDDNSPTDGSDGDENDLDHIPWL